MSTESKRGAGADLARLAGIDSAKARIVLIQDQPIAIIRRLDRTIEQHRIPYLFGATLLQSKRDDEHSYTELLDVMRTKCQNFVDDSRQFRGGCSAATLAGSGPVARGRPASARAA